jgi:hypothetical protein
MRYKNLHNYTFLFCFLSFFQISRSQNIDKSTIQLNNITIYKQTDIIKTIEKVFTNFENNYFKEYITNYNILQLSKKENDTIVHFDGILKISVKYKKSHLYYNHTYGTLCNFVTRRIDGKYFERNFPSNIGKKNKTKVRGGASNKIPFFITGALNMTALMNNNFLTSTKDYTYSIDKADGELIKILFYPNQKETNIYHPLSGYFIINKSDYAILEINYKNDNFYDFNSESETNKINTINVSLKFKNEGDSNKYLLTEFNAECHFNDKIDGLIQKDNYFSKTNIKINKNYPAENCINQDINLTDLGLIFKGQFFIPGDTYKIKK